MVAGRLLCRSRMARATHGPRESAAPDGACGGKCEVCKPGLRREQSSNFAQLGWRGPLEARRDRAPRAARLPPALRSMSVRVKRIFSLNGAAAAAARKATAGRPTAAQLAVLRITSPCADGNGAAAFAGAGAARRGAGGGASEEERELEGHWPNELVRAGGGGLRARERESERERE